MNEKLQLIKSKIIHWMTNEQTPILKTQHSTVFEVQGKKQTKEETG